jgi:dihydroorotase
MRDRALVVEARGHGRSVRRIQAMPTPQPRNTETTTAAITGKRPYTSPRKD